MSEIFRLCYGYIKSVLRPPLTYLIYLPSALGIIPGINRLKELFIPEKCFIYSEVAGLGKISFVRCNRHVIDMVFYYQVQIALEHLNFIPENVVVGKPMRKKPALETHYYLSAPKGEYGVVVGGTREENGFRRCIFFDPLA